ncbi:hypothetical protein C4D60_Mb05t14320 [Musa balbisiana]|uniref:Uncharacterized protein n=1 Tax=Musa balbisiana TaxID=52838 RepID=A0A4V4H866_MUSBA|nr:hypothetical protein C4D60_Mb05t14320 [Musa balbisiana]
MAGELSYLQERVEDQAKVPSSPQVSEWQDKNAGSVGASQGWYGTAHHACCLCVVSQLAELKLSLPLPHPLLLIACGQLLLSYHSPSIGLFFSVPSW